MNLITTLNYTSAVNNVGVSPDGTMMAVVGDSNQIHLHSISNSSEYKKMTSLTGTINLKNTMLIILYIHLNIAQKDAAFSVSWDNTSTRFAASCQDGFVCVWDVRKMDKKLAVLNAFQRNQKGACRVVRFSQTNSVDLLAFSEHASYFNIVDARTFDSQQSIRVAPQGMDLHLTGLVFSPDSDSIFVGIEQGILEYQIDLMSRRSFPTGSLI